MGNQGGIRSAALWLLLGGLVVLARGAKTIAEAWRATDQPSFESARRRSYPGGLR